MVDGGFGDICFEERPGLNLNSLKLVNVPVRPLFLSAPDPPCHHSELLERSSCLCERFKWVGDPVQPRGPLDSRFIFVGRDPGEQEVDNEEPFFPSAPAGALFEEYLESLGMVREEVYITNTNFCRAPGNAAPTPDHIWACASFHKEEFKALTNMEYIFPLGAHAFSAMTGVYGGISSFFGKYFEAEIYGKCVKIIPIYHPGFLLRDPSLREQVFTILSEIGGG